LVRAILTDIEGTTSSLSFVKEQLFPYARMVIPDFIRNNESKLTEILTEIRNIVDTNLTVEETIDVLLAWMDGDRKVTPLKTIQGMIWEEGYKSGALTGHIYSDAYNMLTTWKLRHIPMYVYSSGSVPAQKLLFSHTIHGDINYLFSGYFDTTIGSKLLSQSYTEIASKIGLPIENILFLSDNPEEISCAMHAGMKTRLVDRDNNTPGSISTFYDIENK
jgi:enolase-phosphatase E1